jgi:hypothetical protein
MRTAAAIASLGLLALIGCASQEDYTIVTVSNRPAVHDAAKLAITLTNAGSMRTDELALEGKPFPVTFALTAPGRDGDLTIAIEAFDAAGLLVGRGSAATTIASPTAGVMLDTADFVVNTEFAGDQFPSSDFESHGFQVAAASDGTWTTAFRDACDTPCNMFGRRFDAEGRPVETRVAASANQFAFTTTLTGFISTPAIATAGSTTMAVWDFDDPTSTATGIACRSIDALGMALPDQRTLATDAGTDVASITPLSTGNFAVTWNAFISTSVIRTVVARPDCTVFSGSQQTINVGTTSVHRSAIAASGSPSNIMSAWIADGSVRFRIGDAINGTVVADTLLLAKPASGVEAAEYVRLAPAGNGFAVAVRWASTTTPGTGRIDLYRTNLMGTIMGPALMVTDKAGADFDSKQGFGIATRADGMVMVVWHGCAENGDGDDCGVFGRAINPDGSFVGPAFVVPTTVKAAQTSPSVAALGDSFVVVWRDLSTDDPDHAGAAVRARIVYPSAPPASGM